LPSESKKKESGVKPPHSKVPPRTIAAVSPAAP
jgi:hypothetical protein